MSDINDRQRKRYREDPEYRQRKIAAALAFQKRNRAKVNATRNLRYATKPATREQKRETDYASALKQKYGMTLQQYNAIFAFQEGRCAICMETSEKRLNVDHCHRTKIVRGLLCDYCNKGLGCFRDEPRRLSRATAYAYCYATPEPRGPTE